jgi:hypothetical protein
MAEFKLGRIRFVWKGEWNPSQTYYVDDVIKFGGRTYICRSGHVSESNFNTDLNYSPAKWNILTDGQEWKGDWDTLSVYEIRDIVKYGGNLYICKQGHTSANSFILGLEDDQDLPLQVNSKWDLYAEGLDWKDSWQVSTRYKINDLVKYGGYTYVCNEGHTSANNTTSGLEADQSKWDEFSSGFEYKGIWETNGSSFKYKINDIVKQGSGLWICIDNHVSSSNFISDAATYWQKFVEGVQFEGDWNTLTIYQPGDIVVYGGNQYVAKTNHLGAIPSTSTVNWDLINRGFNFTSDWTSIADYRVGDVVRLSGYTYLAKLDNVNQEPPNLTFWERLNSGIEWQNEWTDDVEYKLGDAVRFSGNAFICVLAHRSEEDDGSSLGGAPNSRPDQDVSGTYWNLLNIGTETSVLTTKGDLVFFGGNGPARLPVGLEGQVLVSDGEIPQWATLGEVDQVYFVSETGTDLSAPTHGKTLNKPWKSIRYACEQVEKGPRNPNTQYLLELNRVFIQREVSAWIRYQIDNATVGSIWENFDYDEYKCERDIGFVIDRLIWDIGHGGNLKIRAAAQSLLGLLSEGPFSKPEEDAPYTTLSLEREQSIAAYNYMLELIEDVSNNESPSIIYQNITDDSTAIAVQYTNTSLTAEDQALTEITSLVAIITDALANPTQNQSLPTIPERYVPFTLIKISTGRYRETLPIIVPAYTCVIGDELRSTNAGPSESLIDISDSYYTINTFEHIESFVGDVVTGTSIVPSSGNFVTQDTSWPVADTDEAVAVTELVKVMKQQADYRLGTINLAKLTDPVGYNVGYLAGHGDARKLIRENTKFLQEEIIEFLENSYSTILFAGSISGTTLTVTSVETGTLYPNLLILNSATVDGTTIVSQLSGTTGGVGTYQVSESQEVQSIQIRGDTRYGKTKTRRDTGYIIDAVIYDLTYGGNAQSVAAGLAYFDGEDPDPNVSAPQIPDSIKTATLDAIGFLKTRMQQVATGATFTPLQTAVPRYTDTAGSAGASTLIGNNIDDIIEIIDVGPGAIGTTVTLTDPATTDGVSSTSALISAYATLNSASTTIRSNAITYINTTYPDLVYDTTRYSRDVDIILKAIGYDFMLGNVASITEFTNYQSLKAAHAYLRLNVFEVYISDQKTITLDVLEYVRTEAIANVGGDSTAIARINVLMELIKNIIYGAANEGQVCSTELRNRDYAVLQLERNREFIVNEVGAYISNTFSGTATNTTITTNVITISDTSWLRRGISIKFTGTTFGNIEADTTYFVHSIVSSTTFRVSLTRNGTALTLTTASGSMLVELVYNRELCLRDVDTYIDALKWDLKYTSNYRSRYVARYYANAVTGSLEEDMYYLRDGTGVRDQTLEGLSGDLTPRNMFGTSRVTAGAYASLDPGWGPDDFRAWIVSRSPYVQGVTTFGTAAIGQKIDGELHNGGNDSIVSNDFTQVISDGIGAWVANNGRAELVSVFSYYAHIGYLSTEGGRIRGTNGNNSYGDFGSVAEGFDSREEPDTAVIDNIFQFKATIASVYTNGSAMLAFQFENAGIDYTEVNYNLLGGGIGASVEADEFRDNGVFQVRLLENAPEGEDGEFGGRDYLTNSSTAQGGSSTSLTLAAVDDESSNAYPGMRIFLTGGAGAGQFAIIDTYNNGTKVATVLREIDDVAAGNFQNGTKYRIISVGTTDFTLIGADNNNLGTIFTASGSGSGTGIALELAAGWAHIVAGTSIVSPDASSTYIIEPALTFTSPAYSSATLTGPAAAAYGVLKYAEQFQTFTSVSSTTSGSGINATFDVIKNGLKYRVFVNAGGTDYERFDTITILGSQIDGADTTNDIVITVTSINSITGEVLTFDFEGIGNGGNFISLLSTSSNQSTVYSNSAWTTTSLPSTDSWTSVASGRLRTPIAANALVAGQSYVITTLGDTIWTAVGAKNNLVDEEFIATGPTSGTGFAIPLISITVAVAYTGGTNTSAYSDDAGLTWTAGGAGAALPADDWIDIAYGDGTWVTIATGSNLTAYSEDGGENWIAGGNLPSSTTWTSIAYGAGKFVAIASGGTAAAYSTDNGATWSSATLPSSSNWNSVAFGNNRFVAISSTSGTVAAYSLTGINWTASTLPASADWTKVGYGQGVFFAVSETTQAASSEDGVVWRSRTISTTDSSGIAFGNPNRVGRFLSISSTGATNVSTISVGARTKARAVVAESKIFEIRILEPGSRYSAAPTLIISDSNKLFEPPFAVRIGNGVLANPSFVNRGSQYVTGNAEVRSGNGFADNFQAGSFVAVRRISDRPVPGSNVVFAHLPMRTFKLVNVFTFLGEFDGSYTAFYQISPPLTISEAANHLEDLNTRLLYSQVRLTGHDFLDIGTGNFEETNYPGGIPENDPNSLKETVESNGGRVFFTATDQDGNFRVGDLFAIEQSTGIATLNADAFNISGLQELSLGNVTLGGGSATITEFSTDPFFTADSNNVIPTQRAIKAYIAGQIGGGGASLNVNSVTAGSIFIAGTQITTVTGVPIRIDATFNFASGVTGIPLALNYFL